MNASLVSMATQVITVPVHSVSFFFYSLIIVDAKP